MTNPADNAKNNIRYIAILKQLERDRFYGEVKFKFENGRIVHIIKAESIKFK